jgi:hypothetical protein
VGVSKDDRSLAGDRSLDWKHFPFFFYKNSVDFVEVVCMLYNALLAATVMVKIYINGSHLYKAIYQALVIGKNT